MCGIGNCFSDRVHRLFQSEKRKTGHCPAFVCGADWNIPDQFCPK